ncbi:uncharacterized protein BDW47DRAFT_107211, partial [Aspergillus candidus]
MGGMAPLFCVIFCYISCLFSFLFYVYLAWVLGHVYVVSLVVLILITFQVVHDFRPGWAWLLDESIKNTKKVRKKFEKS